MQNLKLDDPLFVDEIVSNEIVVIKWNGDEFWTINTNFFTGIPKVTVQKPNSSNLTWIIKLENATYPGTNIKADFNCLFKKDISNDIWLMDLEFKDEEFPFKAYNVDLEKWLKGDVLAEFNQTKFNNKTICELGKIDGEDTLVKIDGNAKSTFSPSWTIEIIGDSTLEDKNIVKLINFHTDNNAKTDIVNIALHSKTSFFKIPSNKRTLLTIPRGDSVWKFETKFYVTDNFPLTINAKKTNSFEKISIECGIDFVNEQKKRVVSVTSTCNLKKITLEFDQEEIKDLNNNKLTITLKQFHYIVDFDSNELSCFSHFNIDEKNEWIIINGNAYKIRDNEKLSSFEVISSKGEASNTFSFSCQPLMINFIPSLGSKDVSHCSIIDYERPLKFVNQKDFDNEGWGILAARIDDDNEVRFSIPADENTTYPPKVPDFAFKILRPNDMFYLEFLFFNFTFKGYGKEDKSRTYLVRKNSGLGIKSWMSINFNNPQNITEEITEEIPRALAAGPSRLVFSLREEIQELEFTLENLLRWEDFFIPSFVPVANVSDPFSDYMMLKPPEICEPSNIQTAIESPWNLFISPCKTLSRIRGNLTSIFPRWNHETDGTVTHNNFTELWHTRLSIDKDEIPDGKNFPKIRAIWTPKYLDCSKGNEVKKTTKFPLVDKDRCDIVNLSSNFYANIPPKAIQVNNLMLSSMGSLMDIHGVWNKMENIDLVEWKHFSTLGRDHLVRLVYRGRVIGPCSYSASLDLTYERKIKTNQNNESVAYLKESKASLLIQQRVIDFDYLEETTEPNKGRDCMFPSVQILDPDEIEIKFPDDKTLPFWVMMPGDGPDNKHIFSLKGKDRNGRDVDFSVPLVFALESFFENGEKLQKVLDVYNTSTVDRTAKLSGQLVAFAKNEAIENDKTSFPTQELRFYVKKIEKPIRDHPPFYPLVDPDASVIISIPTLGKITGNSKKLLNNFSNERIPVKFNEQYLKHEFKKATNGDEANNANNGELFLDLINKVGVEFSQSSDKVGGIATPDLSVSGLSRNFGTVSGNLQNFSQGKFHPEEYFEDVLDKAKLFGTIKLSEILPKEISDIVKYQDQIPKILTINTPKQIETRIAWNAKLEQYNDGKFLKLGFYDGQPTGSFTLNVDIITPTDPKIEPHTTVIGKMEKFYLNLFNLVQINFNRFEFTSKTGEKINTYVELANENNPGTIKQPFQFDGQLKFVEKLKDIIPSNGFSRGDEKNGPFMDVNLEGVKLGYSLLFPNVALGAFSLENLFLKSSFELPFNNKPIMFRFGFNDKHYPFITTVSMLGGGGSFSIALGPEGIQEMDLSIRLGAHSALDFNKLAYGSLTMMAGINLKKDVTNPNPPVEGILEAYGCLEVLGMVSASVLFLLGLTYYPEPEKNYIEGSAIVRVRIKTFFFKKTVSLPLKRKWNVGGSFLLDDKNSTNEKIKDFIDWDAWEEYCVAFS